MESLSPPLPSCPREGKDLRDTRGGGIHNGKLLRPFFSSSNGKQTHKKDAAEEEEKEQGSSRVKEMAIGMQHIRGRERRAPSSSRVHSSLHEATDSSAIFSHISDVFHWIKHDCSERKYCAIILQKIE